MSSLPSVSRRRFCYRLLAGGVAAAVASRGWTRTPRRPKILVRGSWQTVNIGDIAHTPGLLALLEQHVPEAEVTLWPSKIDRGVREVIAARFPDVRIVRSKDEVAGAFRDCDVLLHGSSASLSAEKHLVAWHEQTGKPYGLYTASRFRRSRTPQRLRRHGKRFPMRRSFSSATGSRFRPLPTTASPAPSWTSDPMPRSSAI